MAPRLLTLLSVAAAASFCPAAAQQVGRLSTEEQPPFFLQRCGPRGGCVREQAGLTLDAQRRWLHDAAAKRAAAAGSCGAAGAFNASLCADAKGCAAHCALEGVPLEDYERLYGVAVTSDGAGVRVAYVTGEANIGARLYVTAGEASDRYKMFRLKNREIAFDVDLSTLPCGLNAALYLVEMRPDGGRGRDSSGAGARYGTGYCDARCPHSVNFIEGAANLAKEYGSCCAEVDVWEGNSVATSMSAHPCSVAGATRCQGQACGDGAKGEYYQGICDKDGCEFNPFRVGQQHFFGPGKSVDSSSTFTVVTQFVTDDGTDNSTLSDIRRFYVQDGKRIENPSSSIPGLEGNSISPSFCKAEKLAYVQTRDPTNMVGDYDQFTAKGGMQQVGGALDRGMVLALSLWDSADKLAWLDSVLPGLSKAIPGVWRGPCDPTWGAPEALRKMNAHAFVQFANIRYGELGSTTAATEGRVDEGQSLTRVLDSFGDPPAGGRRRLELPWWPSPTAACSFALAATALVATRRTGRSRCASNQAGIPAEARQHGAARGPASALDPLELETLEASTQHLLPEPKR